MSGERRCGQQCPHLTADKGDRCTLPPRHSGQHVVRETDGSPKYTWQTASRPAHRAGTTDNDDEGTGR